MKRSFLHRLKNKWVIIGVVVVAIVAIAYARSGSSGPSFESVPASIGDVIEQVSVTGSVSPLQESDLSFKKGGVISAIYAQVGDRLTAGQAIASLDSSYDEAAYQAALATLADMTRSLTPAELDVQQTAVENATIAATNADHGALATAQTALYNDADTLFSAPQSANPTIIVRTDSQLQQSTIDAARISVSNEISAWQSDLLDPSLSIDDLTSRTLKHLNAIKAFMIDLSDIASALTPVNSGMSQSAIDADLAAMNSALSGVNSAIDSVSSAQAALSTAESNYQLKLAGNSAQSIAAQKARVDQALADVNADSLLAPFDGILTKADPHVGEYIAPGQSGFSIQDTSFKVEANVPEADIAKVAVGDLASTTLDAYGPYVDFPTQVTKIDPAETVIEGVPTYKVTLRFVSPDPRIRSGMTANLEILTHAHRGVLRIPYRAVQTSATSTTVRVVGADGISWHPVVVETGLKGSDGSIEIVSGLKPGDLVVTYLK